MRTDFDIGHFYDKVVKEFIVNISTECNVEGNKEYKKVYVIGKCVKFSPLIINDYLGRSKSAGSYKILYIDKIAKDIMESEAMTQEMITL